MTREDSQFMYGIAILMMVNHHLFCWNSRNSYSLFSLLPWDNAQVRFAWLCRLCVSIFAFISGYGMCRIAEKKGRTERCRPGEIVHGYRLAVRQILKLMKKYWIVFAIFVPLGLMVHKLDLIGPWHFLLGLLGIDNSYNAEWWYVRQYMFMLMLFPILDWLVCCLYVFCEKNIIRKLSYGRTLLRILSILILLLFAVFRNSGVLIGFINLLDDGRFVYTLIFIEGYLCAFFELFSIGCKSPLYCRIKPFFCLLMLAACIGVRYIRAYGPTYVKYDAFITAPIIYSILILTERFGGFRRIVMRVGKYSTYIWLCHTFFISYYFINFFNSARYAVLIYLMALAVSMVSAVLLTRVEKWLFCSIMGT